MAQARRVPPATAAGVQSSSTPGLPWFPRRVVATARKQLRRLSLHARATLAPLAVAADRLLLGGESGFRAAQYAALIDDLMRPSTPLSVSPHVRLLQEYGRCGDDVFARDVFAGSAYFQNALQAMNATGHYFGLTEEDGILELARDFVDRFRYGSSQRGPRATWRGRTPEGVPVRVCRIKHSDCYEIIDGHHRLAIAYVQGVRRMRVVCTERPVYTPLQKRLLDVLWTKGRRELYQPVDAPELERRWVLVRRCTDRLAMMQSFLHGAGFVAPHGATYLDLASSYGWFVSQMGRFGFHALGVEHDPVAVSVGAAAYGVDPAVITRMDCVRFLKTAGRQYDVVSCMSLLHHFVMGAGGVPAAELMRLLDRVTKRVLFIETGQVTEAWFRTRLAGWDPDFVEEWLRKHSSFRQIHRLGVDEDRVPPFQDNYGRTLFACMR